MDPQIEALRRVSRDAFGQTYRLEVMLAVGDSPDGLVCLTDLAKSLDLSASNVQSSIRSLVATGLLTELPRGDARRKFYIRTDSHAWAWTRELRTGAIEGAAVKGDRHR